MQTLQTTSLRVSENQLFILDQQALPQEKRWLAADNVALLVDHIHALRVRGAPLIGLSASLLLALLAQRGLSRDELQQALETLRAARPTAVNLMNNLDRMKQALAREDYPQALEAEALRLVEEDKQLCDRIAEAGGALVKPGSRLLTHCNTGGPATAGVGTALGVIALAHRQGKVANVWVDETRPLLQGGRLTAWELGELGVPYQLITDSMAASLMAQGQVDAVWVGADRIAANGDVANKIGTYSLAVLAHYHQIPFYVAAPQTTLDRHCPNGAAIPIEQRAAAEVTGVAGSFGAVQWAPTGAAVYNPAFDVTPAGLISGWVLDSGVVTRRKLPPGRLRRTTDSGPCAGPENGFPGPGNRPPLRQDHRYRRGGGPVDTLTQRGDSRPEGTQRTDVGLTAARLTPLLTQHRVLRVRRLQTTQVVEALRRNRPADSVPALRVAPALQHRATARRDISRL